MTIVIIPSIVPSLFPVVAPIFHFSPLAFTFDALLAFAALLAAAFSFFFFLILIFGFSFFILVLCLDFLSFSSSLGRACQSVPSVGSRHHPVSGASPAGHAMRCRASSRIGVGEEGRSEEEGDGAAATSGIAADL